MNNKRPAPLKVSGPGTSCEDSTLLDFVLGIAILILVAVSIVGFIGGGADADFGGRCDYKSFASYWPTRIVACEIWKKRF